MSHDTWIHRLARACVRPLAETSITPNHLTAARLASGILASGLIAVGSTPWTLTGCALFLLSMLLDRADGELARLTEKTSPFGHRFDLWTDALCDTLIVAALGVAQRDGVFGDWAYLLGGIAAAAVAVIFTRVLAVDKALGEGSVMFEATAGFDPDDAIAIVPLSIVVGLGDWTLAAATVAAPVAATIVLWRLGKVLDEASEKE